MNVCFVHIGGIFDHHCLKLSKFESPGQYIQSVPSYQMDTMCSFPAAPLAYGPHADLCMLAYFWTLILIRVPIKYIYVYRTFIFLFLWVFVQVREIQCTALPRGLWCCYEGTAYNSIKRKYAFHSSTEDEFGKFIR